MQRDVRQASSDSTPLRAAADVVVAGNAFRLYAESPPLIDAMVADIAAARSRVWMETYIYADDAAGRRVAAALAERARAGLDVRLLVDGFGSFTMPQAFIERLRADGVQVHVFHSFRRVIRGARFLQKLNQRSHRKLLVVDDAVAYFGGMNVVDQSGLHTVRDAQARQLPASAGWRDVHARIEGPRQAEIAALMDRLWRRVHRQPRARPPRWSVPDFARAADEAIYFFASRPSLADRRPHRVLVPLIRQAQRDITIAMAYFIPIGRVRRELIRARRRGVRVRVILPGRSDVKLVEWASRHYYESLLKHGIGIYERHDRMMHGKAMTIDEEWSVVGSCNLDARSLRINLEFFAVMRSVPLAGELNAIFHEEMAASTPITLEMCRNRRWWQRLRNRLAWELREWL